MEYNRRSGHCRKGALLVVAVVSLAVFVGSGAVAATSSRVGATAARVSGQLQFLDPFTLMVVVHRMEAGVAEIPSIVVGDKVKVAAAAPPVIVPARPAPRSPFIPPPMPGTPRPPRLAPWQP